GELRFRLYRVLPGPAREGFEARWRNRIVKPNEINWGMPGERPRSSAACYDCFVDESVKRDEALAGFRDDFYGALANADAASAGTIWDKAVGIVGGLLWKDLPADAVSALGVLATVRTGRLCLPTKIPATNLPHLVNAMLLEPEERRCWTHAFELLCRAKGLLNLLSRSSVRDKCNRNRMEYSSAIPVDGTAGPVFNVFFPEGSFYRLGFETRGTLMA